MLYFPKYAFSEITLNIRNLHDKDPKIFDFHICALKCCLYRLSHVDIVHDDISRKSVPISPNCLYYCPKDKKNLLLAHLTGSGRESSLPEVSSVVASGRVVVSSIGRHTTAPSAKLILRNFSISPK